MKKSFFCKPNKQAQQRQQQQQLDQYNQQLNYSKQSTYDKRESTSNYQSPLGTNPNIQQQETANNIYSSSTLAKQQQQQLINELNDKNNTYGTQNNSSIKLKRISKNDDFNLDAEYVNKPIDATLIM